MREFRLYNDVMMPAIGFGVYQIPQEETERCVSDALETGYRMIDTAASYLNEKEVGNAIRNSGVKRGDLFITTKLWVQDYETDDALRAFDKSMKLLSLDYLDLYLLHKPYGNYYAAWRAAERLYREGRVKAIGVTSFSSERLQDLILHNEVRPMVNQLQTNPWYQQKQARQYLAEENIQMEAWAPFAEGKNDIFNNPMLVSIAKAHGKTVAQIILRWLVQLNIAVIPKTVSRERMKANLNIFNFDLDENEVKAIASLDTGIDPIYDDQDLETTKFIGTHKIHD
ncbi:MAG: aldo/keto reductase [Desulfovibrio sp.]|nr:aldo/keto reductase [Desulfovibrio sp.]